MRRGFLAGLALAGSLFAVPASAASTGVVYEVVRGSGSSFIATVSMSHVGNDLGIALAALLAPAGPAYVARTVYGIQTSPGVTATLTVQMSTGSRLLVGAERGRLRVAVDQRGWSVRELGPGFRTVRADGGVDGLGLVDAFPKVSAPAGRYGSVALAAAPCSPGYGEWTLRTDADESQTYGCDALSDNAAVGQTARGRTWTFEADTVGMRAWEYRLAVLDFPQRRR